MKKISLVCFFASVISSTCHAQSTVTLYGILDEGLMYTNNVAGGSRYTLDSLTGVFGSRWGMTGTEDLGGGLRAVFTLESGINLNNGQLGQGGTAFGRQAFVGLASNDLGSLTLGRQYDMVFYFPEPLTAANLMGGAATTHLGDLDNAANTVRVNNAVRYMSPMYRGLQFGAEYSMGGVTGNFTSTSGYSIGAGYSNGPLKIGGAFEYFKNPTAAPGTGFFTAYANGASPLSQSLNKGYAIAQAYQDAIIAANYTFGAITLGASYSNVQYANLGPEFANGTAIFNSYDIGVLYRYSPFLSFGAGYNYVNSKGVLGDLAKQVGNQHYNQVFFHTDYTLSKRSDIYFQVGWQRAAGTSSLGTPAVADIDNLGDSSNNRQLLLRLALREKF